MKEKNKAEKSQFTLVDQIFNHDQKSLAHIFIFAGKALPKGIPTNWQSPINFCEGKIYIRVRVLKKPTKAPVRYMLYLMSGGHGDAYRAVVGHNLVTFSEPGTYTFEQSMLSILDYSNIDWSQSLEEMLVSVWDQHNFPIETRWGHGGKWEGSPDLTLYYPMKIHYTAVVVAKNGKFQGFPGRLSLFQAELIRLISKWRYWLRTHLRRD
ncbi:MAG: hypothetical protein ACAF41_02150 [Leptolyngbya sp. BL-A-14]